MIITEQIKKDVNLIVGAIAEDIYQEDHFDDDGHQFQMHWDDCVDHAIEEFCDDTYRCMETAGYDLTDEECGAVGDYVLNYVNTYTIYITNEARNKEIQKARGELG